MLAADHSGGRGGDSHAADRAVSQPHAAHGDRERFYTGANSQAVETSVTTLLEQAINGAEGMRYMSSTSGNDGSSVITATFDLDRNLDMAAVDVQNRASTRAGPTARSKCRPRE